MKRILALASLLAISGCASVSAVDRVSEAERQWAMPMRTQNGETLYYLAGRGWFFEDGVILPGPPFPDLDPAEALYECEPRSDLCG